MTIRKTLLTLLTIIGFTTPIFAEDTSSRLGALLSSYQSMTANFSQQILSDKGKSTKKSVGDMAIQRPGKFLWNIHSPNKQKLIANGEVFWNYDVALEQATKDKLDTKSQESPASLLVGSTEDIQKRFHVEPLKSSGKGEGFRLTPMTENDVFQWVEIDFENDKLKSMRLLDNLGQLSEFQFSQVKLNPKLSASLFEFTPPPGVDVISNQAKK